MKNTEYRAGQLDGLVAFLSERHGINEMALRTELHQQFPQLDDFKRCPNCDASMAEYVYTFDIHNALLLHKLGQIVLSSVRAGVPFTEANHVHVPSLDIHHALQSRTTQASKLGLIAKYCPNGVSQLSGHWLITERGFAALRGEAVPKFVKVWRKDIIERYEETTTISEAFQTYTASIVDQHARNKETKNDYTKELTNYSPSDYYHIGGYHDGKLF